MERDRVLDEMQQVGLRATWLGPEGFMPVKPSDLDPILGSRGMQLVGGFVPVRLYREEILGSELHFAKRAATTLAGAGAKTFVLGPASVNDGYDLPTVLTDDEWSVFDQGLRRLTGICEERGLVTALHSHWSMVVDRPDQIERLLEQSEVDICLDTGHVALSGGDPLEVAKLAGDRVVHVHLKDVDEQMAEQVRAGERPFRRAVIEGLFKPLGKGFVDISGVIRYLEENHYQGWYVLEQDAAIADGDLSAVAWLRRNADLSLEFLRNLDPAPAGPRATHNNHRFPAG